MNKKREKQRQTDRHKKPNSPKQWGVLIWDLFKTIGKI